MNVTNMMLLIEPNTKMLKVASLMCVAGTLREGIVTMAPTAVSATMQQQNHLKLGLAYLGKLLKPFQSSLEVHFKAQILERKSAGDILSFMVSPATAQSRTF
jgi:hypothetical protein